MFFLIQYTCTSYIYIDNHNEQKQNSKCFFYSIYFMYILTIIMNKNKTVNVILFFLFNILHVYIDNHNEQKQNSKCYFFLFNILHVYIDNHNEQKQNSKSRAWCKTIVTTSFYIRSYNSFAPIPVHVF